MSFKPEVMTNSSGQWSDNALRFATREEALLNAGDLMARWILVQDYRATESTDPVNYAWVNGKLEDVK
jgi:hypothetical protein